METLSLYYFSELAKDLHMTRTASRLYISQQSLSNHVQRLEREFGTELLTRKPGLQLTYAGQQVLEYAQTVLKAEENIRNTLLDVKQDTRGILRFGASQLRMDACLPEVLEPFYADYPNVQLHLAIHPSAVLEQMLERGELDIAIISSDTPKPGFSARELIADQTYLCVPDALLRTYYPDYTAAVRQKLLHGAELPELAKLPVCLINSRLGVRIQSLFSKHNIHPNTVMSTPHLQFGMDACFRGIAACFATQMSLTAMQHPIPGNIHVFPLKEDGRPLAQTFLAVHRSGIYQPVFSRCFLDLIADRFSAIRQQEYARIADVPDSERELVSDALTNEVIR